MPSYMANNCPRIEKRKTGQRLAGLSRDRVDSHEWCPESCCGIQKRIPLEWKRETFRRLSDMRH